MISSTNTLLAAIVPALVSSYQIGFQETVAVAGDPYNQDSPIEFTQYLNEDDIAPPCLSAPIFPNGYIEKVYLRNGLPEPRPPLAMAFFNAYGDQIDPTTPCSNGNFLFAVRWYPNADSEQTFIPPDGTFTHFQEIRPIDAGWPDVENIGDGSILYREDEGNYATFRGIVTYQQLFLSDSPELQGPLDLPGDEEYSEFTIPEDAAGYNDFFPNSLADTAANSASQGLSGPQVSPPTDNIISESSGTGTMPDNQAGIQAVGTGPQQNLFSNLLELMGVTDLPNAFKEQFEFEQRYPDFFRMMVDQFIESRRDALQDGIYVPAPLGLLLRYSNEELQQMGLEQDPVLEIDSWAFIHNAREQNPQYDTQTPLIFRMFEGRAPGMFQAVLDNYINSAINEITQREDDVDYTSESVSQFETTEPSTPEQAGSVAESNTWLERLPENPLDLIPEQLTGEEDLSQTEFLATPNQDPSNSNLGSPGI
ncbi:hypothetical protein Dda_5323 [Drechslerella dactyloides]|uniref:Uncharacterized protein n=1 Tax=Drechslerella dactyloides TaxID=74499 RepID=A0AAD6IVV9_DREDA|nr:hypothetical protein Dda_5323 [Drechslerella dactyloides]